ncbi:MAG: hypothetical protein GTO02_15180, partial [Candidatus Dadabacteria bacterium]|nr:hypothetical protein [Candidatus Dadabacteria bacterium]
MSKRNIVIIIIVLLIIGYFVFARSGQEVKENGQATVVNTGIRCEAKEMIFYYLDQCEWCQKVKNEGTISKIEELGIKVKQVNAKVGPIRHQFQGVPTFVIDEKVYSGYRTFEELKELLNCSEEKDQLLEKTNEFIGQNGERVDLE